MTWMCAHMHACLAMHNTLASTARVQACHRCTCKMISRIRRPHANMCCAHVHGIARLCKRLMRMRVCVHGTPSPIHEARERHPLANIILASAHPPHPLRILAGELQAGARAGTPKQKVFSLLIIYNQFRKLQDPIGKTQTRSRSRRVPAGGFKIPI